MEAVLQRSFFFTCHLHILLAFIDVVVILKACMLFSLFE